MQAIGEGLKRVKPPVTEFTEKYGDQLKDLDNISPYGFCPVEYQDRLCLVAGLKKPSIDEITNRKYGWTFLGEERQYRSRENKDTEWKTNTDIVMDRAYDFERYLRWAEKNKSDLTPTERLIFTICAFLKSGRYQVPEKIFELKEQEKREKESF